MPVGGHFPAHDNGVERLGEQASFYIFTSDSRDDIGARAHEHVPLELETDSSSSTKSTRP